MILFYLLAAYCLVKFIVSTRNNIKSVYTINDHFELQDAKPHHIYIESLITALIDCFAIFIVGSIAIYALICVAEDFHIGGLL